MSRWQRCDVSSPGGAATNGPPGRLHIALTRPAYARALRSKPRRKAVDAFCPVDTPERLGHQRRELCGKLGDDGMR